MPTVLCATFSILISVIGRILRLLATQHIFKEVAPDVFANNRISSTIDTYKSVAEINAKYVSLVEIGSALRSHMFPVPSPQDKHNGTSGTAALADHL